MANSDFNLNASFELIGAFWPHESSNQRFTGTLSSKKGRLFLKSAPQYDEAAPNTAAHQFFTAFNERNHEQRIQSVCAFTEKGECTLLSLLPLNDGGLTDCSTGQSIVSAQYRVSAAVMGMHVGSSDAELIQSCTYRFTRVENWFPSVLGIRWEQDAQSFVIPTEEFEVFRFQCQAIGADILCEVRASGGVKAGRRARIKSEMRITVTPENLKSVDWFFGVGVRLENFLSLCLGTSVALKRIQLSADGKKGCLIRAVRRKSEKTNVQLWLKCPSSVLTSALDLWLSVPEEKRPVERTVLGMLRKVSVFVETEFLSLAQAIEGFDRIHGCRRRKNFAERIEETYEMLSSEFASSLLGDKQQFVRRVVDTRNVYTHLGLSAGSSAVQDGGNLFELNQRLHAFLRCVMLINLGIDESLLREPILYQATRWRLS